MILTRIIAGFENRFVGAFNSTIQNRYATHRVSRDINEDWTRELGSQAGILRYDSMNDSLDYFEYDPSVHIENFNATPFYNYFVYVHWGEFYSEISIHRLNIEQLQAKEVYRLQLDEFDSENRDSSKVWNTLVYGLSKNYFILAIPDSPSSPKLSYSGFAKYLLVDIKSQKSLIIQEKIGVNDNILNTDSIDLINDNEKTFLVIKTGRISAFEKEEILNSGDAMNAHTKIQSVVLIELEYFISLIHEKKTIPATSIISDCDSNQAFISVETNEHQIYIYKYHLIKGTSELLIYNVQASTKRSIHFNEQYKKIFIHEKKLYGLLNTLNESHIYALTETNKELIYSTSSEHTIKWCNDEYTLVNQNLPNGERELKLIRMQDHQIIETIISKQSNFNYIPEHNKMLFFP